MRIAQVVEYVGQHRKQYLSRSQPGDERPVPSDARFPVKAALTEECVVFPITGGNMLEQPAGCPISRLADSKQSIGKRSNT
jgi:hypothetical protein